MSKQIIIREEREPYSKTGTCFRAFYAEDASPLYMGAETQAELLERIQDYYPGSIINRVYYLEVK
jgi:hypothetical protein